MKLICVVLLIAVTVSLGDQVPRDWNGSDYYDYAAGVDSGSNEADFESSEIGKARYENSKDDSAIDAVALGDDQKDENLSDSEEKPADDETPLEADGEPDPDDGDSVEDFQSKEQKDSDEILSAVRLGEEPQSDDGSEETNDEDAVDDDSWGDIVDQEVESLPVPESDGLNKILQETREILDDDAENNFDDQSDADIKNGESKESEDKIDNLMDDMDTMLDIENIIYDEQEAKSDEDVLSENKDDHQPAVDIKNEESKESQDAIKEQIDEINKILDVDNIVYDEQEAKSNEDVFSENKDEDNAGEDTVDKAYADLNADLDKLLETFDKLNDNEPEEPGSNEEVKVDNVKDYEEKYGWPYKEASVLAERDFEYESIDDSNLSDIFENAANDAVDEAVDSDKNNDSEEINDSLDDNVDSNIDADIDENENSNENVETDVRATEKANIEPIVEPINAEIVNEEKKSEEESDGFDDNLYDEPDLEEDKEEETILNSIFNDKQPYGEDGLIDETKPKDGDAEEIGPIDYENGGDAIDLFEGWKDVPEISKTTQKSISVDELNSAQLDDLMAQFEIAHQEDLDVDSDDFDKHIAPIHITLSDDNAVEISSPNYPSPYPTNNIIDWIIEVDGSCIELNITDLAVNGALGDYLLIKPGGLDETGREGIVLSYHLNAIRKYRFFNVNKMFVRFEAKMGLPLSSSRGFSFSVKRIFAPGPEPEPVPDPEPVIEPPRHTLTINLAGLSMVDFSKIQDDFVSLIADMASQYISTSGIYLGFNSTLEVTQITRTAVCSIHWPNYETCVEVTFGVPLNYGEEELEPRLNAEDLEDMWNTMITKEYFAAQLDAMGIKEYVIPNDRTVLTVWLVIAAGVVMSMAMLAFALWRFSCFEDYTRMRAFSDTDSIRNEKRNLDLYPTPHQTLPPLYSENEYKWADEKYDDSTRVDMGGFGNKSYVRDELYQFDSDEDVIAPRDRKGAISSKDIYEV